MTRYKKFIQKPIALLFTNGTHAEEEMMEIIPFIIAIINVKYLEVKTMKEVLSSIMKISKHKKGPISQETN